LTHLRHNVNDTRLFCCCIVVREKGGGFPGHIRGSIASCGFKHKAEPLVLRCNSPDGTSLTFYVYFNLSKRKFKISILSFLKHFCIDRLKKLTLLISDCVPSHIRTICMACFLLEGHCRCENSYRNAQNALFCIS